MLIATSSPSDTYKPCNTVNADSGVGFSPRSAKAGMDGHSTILHNVTGSWTTKCLHWTTPRSGRCRWAKS